MAEEAAGADAPTAMETEGAEGMATDSVEAGEVGVVGEVPGADTGSAAGDGEGGATDGISADGAGEETMSGGACDETSAAPELEGAEHSDANSAGCIAAAELVLQRADQEEKAFLRRQRDLEAQKSVILHNLLKAKEQELWKHKAEAQQQLEKSNKEAAQVTVPRCVRCSLVASKQVHAADFDANFAGRNSLLPGRKTRLRRRRHKRNMTNS